MKPKIEEFADKRQLKGWGFYDGVVIGTEAIKWAICEGWEYDGDDKWSLCIGVRKRPSSNVYNYATTTELIDMFIDKSTRSL